MVAALQPLVFRLVLPCADEAEFRQKFVPKLTTRGIRLRANELKPIGTQLVLRLRLKNSQEIVGDAVVAGHAPAGQPPAMVLQYLRLDPTSGIHFELRPIEENTAVQQVEEDKPTTVRSYDPRQLLRAAGLAAGAASGEFPLPPEVPTSPQLVRPTDPGPVVPPIAPVRPADTGPVVPPIAPVWLSPPLPPVASPPDPWAAMLPAHSAPQVDWVASEALFQPPAPGPVPSELSPAPGPPAQPWVAPPPAEWEVDVDATGVGVQPLPLTVGPAEAPTLRPFDVFGNYQVLKRLGRGGMAEVYLARAMLGEGIEKLVALKMVLPEFRPGTPLGDMFLNEARLSVTFQHPNVVHVFDYGEAGGRPFLAMEFVHGRDGSAVLGRLRQKSPRPPLNAVVAIAIEVAKALEYLHQKKDLGGRPLGLVHRDVSPGNILLSEQGEVKLVDFGVAAIGAEMKKGDGMVVGKRAYMSPEQARGGTASPSWDIYAFGACLHEMLTLERLFEGNSKTEALTEVRRTRQLPPSSSNPEVPPELDSLVMDATDPDASRRLSSAADVRARLSRIAEQLPPVDLGDFMKALFSEEFAASQAEVEKLTLEARGLSTSGPLGRALKAVRRRITAHPWFWALRQRPRLALGLGAFAVVSLLGAGTVGFVSHARTVSLTRELVAADRRLGEGQWTTPKGDSALDHLSAARAMSPGDERVSLRLKKFAAKVEGLGDFATARGNDAEALVHYQAAALADPLGAAPAKLTALEQAIRTRSRKH